MRIVLATFGSLGDLHPYLALALELQARGHEAIIATHAVYRSKIESTGLSFRALRPDYDPSDLEMHRKTTRAWSGSKTVIEFLFSVLQETYDDLQTATRDADLLISHITIAAAPPLAEVTGIPWISSVLAPFSMFSFFDPPHALPVPWLNRVLSGPPLLRAAFRYLARKQTEAWSRPVVEFRAALGLGPGGNPLLEGQHSPLLVLALFSRWFGAPQLDWPAQTAQTGFLFYDTHNELAPDLVEFLAEGSPPIVFTLGSTAVVDPGSFFTRSFEAVRRMGSRAVLVAGPHAHSLGGTGNIFVTPYAPFTQLLRYASAVVHQGGIGTTAQTLRAGKPALVVPFAHDQFDNAARVVRLGAGRSVPRRRYTIDTAELELGMLFGDPCYTEAAAEIGEALRSESSTRAAATAVEAAMAAASSDRGPSVEPSETPDSAC